ncbi:MAG: ATP phosphoribosyltransferase regulatory subunit [Gammaproteobacteria bacterium]|nr:ATP phosphoribosyltransferase regulatory subunit [Gammaproteobacteria bacterium]
MNQLDHWLLPDGVEDLLPPTAGKLEAAREILIRVFTSWGFDYVMPPKLEFIDSLLTGTGKDLDLQTIKVIDQLSGRLMGLPADITPQVARIDAHSLPSEGVNRLCYAGSVVRSRPEGFVGARVPIKAGAELFGDRSIEADFEIMSLMISSLHSLGLDDIHVELGDVSVYRTLIEQAALDSSVGDEIFGLIQKKARQALVQSTTAWVKDRDLADRINALPDLCGSANVLVDAKQIFAGDSVALSAVERLRALIERLSSRFPTLTLSIDLSELRGFSYHTGVGFAAYHNGSGRLMARGGRYDNVGELFGRARPATGFDIELSSLLDQLPSTETDPLVDVDTVDQPTKEIEAALWEKLAALRSEGYRVIEGESVGKQALKRLQFDGSKWVLEDR